MTETHDATWPCCRHCLSGCDKDDHTLPCGLCDPDAETQPLDVVSPVDLAAIYGVDTLCVVCLQPVEVMAFRGSDTCSIDCAKAHDEGVEVTTIKASCPVCGEVSLTNRDVVLHICENDEARSTYFFVCPTCTRVIEKPADDHIRALLIGGGVTVEWWRIPPEALEPRDGPPLTLDDLLDLHIELNAGPLDLSTLTDRTTT